MSAVLVEPPIINNKSLELGLGVFKVDLGAKFEFSDEEFAALCARNHNLRIERTKEGDIVVMPPTFSKTGLYNFNLTGEFRIWSKNDGTGVGFDSSAGFTLPNGAVRSPDLSWIRRARWEDLSFEDQEGFAHICPDFVVEIRSETDRLFIVKAKLDEYLANGAQLGWLIDPVDRRVYIYRPNSDVEILEDPKTVSGEPLLRGFELSMAAIWD